MAAGRCTRRHRGGADRGGAAGRRSARRAGARRRFGARGGRLGHGAAGDRAGRRTDAGRRTAPRRPGRQPGRRAGRRGRARDDRAARPGRRTPTVRPLSVGTGPGGSVRCGDVRDKPVAQYVGGAARIAERARRLAAVEAEQAAATVERESAAEAEKVAADGRTVLLGWLDRLPSSAALRAAWVRRDERSAARDRAQAEATASSERLTAATAELARSVEALERLCAEHDLPADRDALEARGAALTDLDVSGSRRCAPRRHGCSPLPAGSRRTARPPSATQTRPSAPTPRPTRRSAMPATPCRRARRCSTPSASR